jgi:hypothetical protein
MVRTKFISALLAVVAAGTSVTAQTADQRPTLEIVLDNRAPFSGVELGAAQARARFLFGEAGIQLAFLTRDQSRDIEAGGLDRIHLVLLDEAASARLFAGDGRRLAFAIPPANRVYVHYDRVHALARSHGAAPGWFLGVVIAHELTHVLLPRAGHTHEGVMAAALSPDPRTPPAFTREHAALMRARLGGQTLLALK